MIDIMQWLIAVLGLGLILAVLLFLWGMLGLAAYLEVTGRREEKRNQNESR